MREYVGPTYQAREVAFVPGDPPRLAAVDHQAAYLWRPDRPDPLVLSVRQMAYRVPVLTVSPDGQWLVAGPDDRLRGWDVSADPPGPPLDLGRRGQIAARFAGRSDRLTVIVKAARGRTVRLRAGQVRLTRAGPAAPVRVGTFDVPAVLPDGWRMTALSDDGRRLAQHDGDRAIHVWDVGTGHRPRTLPLRGLPDALAFAPDGSRLAVDAGTTVYVHAADTLELLVRWKAKYSYGSTLAWSPDGRLLARTDNSTTVRIYEAATGRPVLALGARRGRLGCAAFSPDGLTLATGTRDGPVRVWDVE